MKNYLLPLYFVTTAATLSAQVDEQCSAELSDAYQFSQNSIRQSNNCMELYNSLVKLYGDRTVETDNLEQAIYDTPYQVYKYAREQFDLGMGVPKYIKVSAKSSWSRLEFEGMIPFPDCFITLDNDSFATGFELNEEGDKLIGVKARMLHDTVSSDDLDEMIYQLSHHNSRESNEVLCPDMDLHYPEIRNIDDEKRLFLFAPTK